MRQRLVREIRASQGSDHPNGFRNAGRKWQRSSSELPTISMICHGLNMLCRKKVLIYLMGFFVSSRQYSQAWVYHLNGRLNLPQKTWAESTEQGKQISQPRFQPKSGDPGRPNQGVGYYDQLTMCSHPVPPLDKQPQVKRSDGRALPEWLSPEIILIKTTHVPSGLL